MKHCKSNTFFETLNLCLRYCSCTNINVVVYLEIICLLHVREDPTESNVFVLFYCFLFCVLSLFGFCFVGMHECTYVRICMYVCMYVCIYVCVYVCTYVVIYVVCMPICMYECLVLILQLVIKLPVNPQSETQTQTLVSAPYCSSCADNCAR